MRNSCKNAQVGNHLNEDKVAKEFSETLTGNYEIEKDVGTENSVKFSGNVPDGKRLLATLVELLADQYGVKIKYEIVDTKNGEIYRGDSEQNSIFGFNGIRKR